MGLCSIFAHLEYSETKIGEGSAFIWVNHGAVWLNDAYCA